MNKSLMVCLLSFAGLPSPTQAVEINVELIGIEDTARATTLQMTNGHQMFVLLPNFSDHHLETFTYWAPHSLVNGVAEYGHPIGADVTGTRISGQWTNYRGAVPDSWVGQPVSFALNGQWSPLRFIAPTNPSDYFIFDVAELGGNPFPQGQNNPHLNTRSLGNLNLLGGTWADINSAPFTLGTWDSPHPGFPCVGLELTASEANSFWRWNYPGGKAMELDHLNRLHVFGRSGGRITIDPSSGIFFNGMHVLHQANAQAHLSPFFIPRSQGGINLGHQTINPGPTAADGSAQIILGRFNDATIHPTTGVDRRKSVLVVGNGQSATARTNALRIRADGALLIRPQGNLGMGAFDKGEEP